MTYYLAVIGWSLFCLLLTGIALQSLLRRTPRWNTMCQCGHECHLHFLGKGGCWKRDEGCYCCYFVACESPMLIQGRDQDIERLRKMAGLEPLSK